jgi:hypothetical protein
VVDAEIRAGGRTISGDTSSSKFNEYRDLRPGGWGANFLVEDPNGVTFLWGATSTTWATTTRAARFKPVSGGACACSAVPELLHVLQQRRARSTLSGSNLLDFPMRCRRSRALPPIQRPRLERLPADLLAPASPMRAGRRSYQLRTIVGG